MPDVPISGANSLQTTGQSTPHNSSLNSRDVEDIDRELEAYLEEKRTGKKENFDYSVDDQLSKIRAKFGMRVTPTKEADKPREVEEVRRSPLDMSPARGTMNTAQVQTRDTTQMAASPTLSHEELIRSLEEKYSTGPTNNTPPQPKQDPVVPKKDTVVPPRNTEEVHSPAEEKATPKVEETPKVQDNSLLTDLKESIQPLDNAHIQSLLEKARALDPEKQKSLVEAFLTRFKRNKERLELFKKTQGELESEFESTLNAQNNSGIQNRANKPQEIPTQVANTPTPGTQNQNPDQNNKENVRTDSAPPVSPETQIPSDQGLKVKYDAYLAGLEKKPTVLVYDMHKGFVRKPIDPADTSLILSYSLESATQTALLTVSDTKGVKLGEVRTPQGELEN